MATAPMDPTREDDEWKAFHGRFHRRFESPPDALAWAPIGGARSYRVAIRDASALVLWTSTPVTQAEVALPRDARALLSGGGSFIWSVDASIANERRETGPYRFRIHPD